MEMKTAEAIIEGIYIDLRRRQAKANTKSGQEASGDEDLVPLRHRYQNPSEGCQRRCGHNGVLPAESLQHEPGRDAATQCAGRGR